MNGDNPYYTVSQFQMGQLLDQPTTQQASQPAPSASSSENTKGALYGLVGQLGSSAGQIAQAGNVQKAGYNPPNSYQPILANVAATKLPQNNLTLRA